MSANRLFLVCSHHPQPEHALCIADVGLADDHKNRYFPAAMCRCYGKCGCAAKALNETNMWFKKHAHCGADRDHFKIAYAKSQDWDLSPPAQDTVAGAVRMGLINGSAAGHGVNGGHGINGSTNDHGDEQ